MEALFAHGLKVILGLLAVVLVMLAVTAPSGTRQDVPPAAVQPPPIQPRKTLRKTTQNVLDITAARRQGGVYAEDVREPAAGLEVYSQAYRESVGRIAVLAVEQKMKLHEAEHGHVPATYEEFMQAIIAAGQPDGLHLPMLPYYQEYAYDPEMKKLVVMEFPAKKEQRRKETTGAAGL
ncbi:MAG: hypothetical protein ACK6CT_12110 [Planctomycetia bacterium]